jgi:hypothetical protein
MKADSPTLADDAARQLRKADAIACSGKGFYAMTPRFAPFLAVARVSRHSANSDAP